MFIALVLDPRHKLNYVEYIVRRSYDTTSSFISNDYKCFGIFIWLLFIIRTPTK